MAKINVHYASFPFSEINVFDGVLSIKTRMFQLLGETVTPAQFCRLEVASAERVNQICGEHGRSIAGEILTHKLEALAGSIVTGLSYETLFALTLHDGRTLIGTVETYAWYEMVEEMERLAGERESAALSRAGSAGRSRKSGEYSRNEEAFDALVRRVNAARHAGSLSDPDGF